MWTSDTWRWLRRFGPDGIEDASHVPPAQRLRAHMAERVIASDDSVALRVYVAEERARSRGYLRGPLLRAPQHARGAHLLMRCRLSDFWDGRSLARAGLIEREFGEKCPCCMDDEDGPETVEHMLMHCPAWEVQRQQHLGLSEDEEATHLHVLGTGTRGRTHTQLWVRSHWQNTARFLAAIARPRARALRAAGLGA